MHPRVDTVTIFPYKHFLIVLTNCDVIIAADVFVDSDVMRVEGDMRAIEVITVVKSPSPRLVGSAPVSDECITQRFI